MSWRRRAGTSCTSERWGCGPRRRPPDRPRRRPKILISADTDFGTLLAASHESGPSVVLVRRVIGRRVEQLAGLLVANLPPVEEDLRLGSIVVIGDDFLRVRRLPSADDLTLFSSSRACGWW